MPKPVLYALSPLTKIMSMPRVQRVLLDHDLKALGIHEYSWDTELLFHCDKANFSKLAEIAVKFELNLTQLGE